jgi:hypothetical protein
MRRTCGSLWVGLWIVLCLGSSQCRAQRPAAVGRAEALAAAYEDFAGPVDRLLSFQIPVIEKNVTSILRPDADATAIERTTSPVGWVHAAFLIGLKDWASVTGNAEWWTWLSVCLAKLTIGLQGTT